MEGHPPHFSKMLFHGPVKVYFITLSVPNKTFFCFFLENKIVKFQMAFLFYYHHSFYVGPLQQQHRFVQQKVGL